MTQWFGYKPFAKACEPDGHAATPIGVSCVWCDDPIMPDDDGFLLPMMAACGHSVSRPWHLNCQIRSVIGGVNHQQQRCFCFGGKVHSDPDGLTAREAADAAVAFWQGGRDV